MVGVWPQTQINQRSLCVASRRTEAFAECFNGKMRAKTLKDKLGSPLWLDFCGLMWI